MEYASKGLAGTALGLASAAPRWVWQTAGSAICWAASDRTTGRLPQK